MKKKICHHPTGSVTQQANYLKQREKEKKLAIKRFNNGVIFHYATRYAYGKILLSVLSEAT